MFSIISNVRITCFNHWNLWSSSVNLKTNYITLKLKKKKNNINMKQWYHILMSHTLRSDKSPTSVSSSLFKN